MTAPAGNRRRKPATGTVEPGRGGKQVKLSVGWPPERFAEITAIAAEKGGISAASVVRALVEVGLQVTAATGRELTIAKPFDPAALAVSMQPQLVLSIQEYIHRYHPELAASPTLLPAPEGNPE